MKNLNLTYIITALILSSGIVGYGLINYNQTKLAAQEQQTNKVVKVITPTTQPTITPIPTLTDAQYLDEVVTLHNCQTGQVKQVKRSYLPKYGLSVDYVPGSRPCPASQSTQSNDNQTQQQLENIQQKQQEILDQQQQAERQAQEQQNMQEYKADMNCIANGGAPTVLGCLLNK